LQVVEPLLGVAPPCYHVPFMAPPGGRSFPVGYFFGLQGGRGSKSRLPPGGYFFCSLFREVYFVPGSTLLDTLTASKNQFFADEGFWLCQIRTPGGTDCGVLGGPATVAPGVKTGNNSTPGYYVKPHVRGDWCSLQQVTR